MSIEVDALAEKRLFTDVELIKQKQQATDEHVQNLLREFVVHSKETNENLSKLALATQELVVESRGSTRRIEELERHVETHVSRNEDDFRTLGKRVVEIEKWRVELIAKFETEASRKKWWSDNWHKIFMVGVVSVPVIVALYTLVKGV